MQYEILQLEHEISSFPEVLYKKTCSEKLLKFYRKIQEQSFGGILSKYILKNFAKFTEKHICRCLFFNKVAG